MTYFYEIECIEFLNSNKLEERCSKWFHTVSGMVQYHTRFDSKPLLKHHDAVSLSREHPEVSNGYRAHLLLISRSR